MVIISTARGIQKNDIIQQNNSTNRKSLYINFCYGYQNFAYFFNDHISEECPPMTKYCVSINGYTKLKPKSFRKGCSIGLIQKECDVC
uniref:Uncharacterized protein n=1 Tax=Parastrongyloides trichosuri TaxID=131310 RepID=A0A0N4ZCB9_PARTI